MKLIEISPVEFNELACCEPNKSFYQTSNWGQFYSRLQYTPMYIGYKDENNIYSACGLFLLSKKESLFSRKNAVCPFGFLTNYHDSELLSKFNKDLVKFLSRKGVGTLTINPNIPYITSRGNNDYLINQLINLGYKKTKNNHVYTVNINETDNSNGIENDLLNAYVVNNDIDRHKLYKANINYKHLYETMGDLVKFVVCEMDVNKGINNLTKTIEDDKEFIETHQGDNNLDVEIENKTKLINDNQSSLDLFNKCKNELGDNPLLAVTCLVEYNHKIYKLFTDDKKDYAIFKALDILNNKTLETITSLGYESYDCFLASDNAQKTELIGEFTYRIK